MSIHQKMKGEKDPRLSIAFRTTGVLLQFGVKQHYDC